MRLGVLGGSFDPVHAGHLAVARAAVRRLRLDAVLFVPARRSPFKKDGPTPARHRLAMLKLALRGFRRAAIDSCELRRPGLSYTVDTLRAFRRRWPEAEFFLLIGADSLPDFPRWRRAGEIRRLAVPVVFPRPGHPLPRHLPAGVRGLPLRPHPAASRALRAALAGGKSPQTGCPKAVLAYALRHRLYRASK